MWGADFFAWAAKAGAAKLSVVNKQTSRSFMSV